MRVWGQEQELASWTVSEVRKQNDECCGSAKFLVLIQCGLLAHGMVLPPHLG